jgi:ADP-heptose:LPS heptosyltransferase
MTEVLVMSFSHIGDAVLSTCVVEPLRALYAPARIVFLAGPLPAALLRAEPGIDEVILHSRESHGGLLGRARLVRELRRRRFDVVVDLKDAVYSRLMGAKRIGLRDRGRTHAVDRYLGAVQAAGAAVDGARPTLSPTADETRVASDWIDAVGGPRVTMHLGGGWEYKLWPPDRFASVADRLATEHGARIALLAGPDDADRVATFNDAAQVDHAVARGLSLREMTALIAACDLHIGNDTGPMHIADAVGTPAVALFEPTDEVRSGPYGSQHTVLRSGFDKGCNPCHPGRAGACGVGYCEPLLRIDVDRVVAAAAAHLSEGGPT